MEAGPSYGGSLRHRANGKPPPPTFSPFPAGDGVSLQSEEPGISRLKCSNSQPNSLNSNRMSNSNHVHPTIVESFSLPDGSKNCTTEDNLRKPNQNPTTYTMKKKKLEHFIDNLFNKVANEKVTVDEENDRFDVKNSNGIPSSVVENGESGLGKVVVKIENDIGEQHFIKREIKLENGERKFFSVREDPIGSCNSSTVSMKIKSDLDDDTESIPPLEPQVLLKTEEDVKPTERVFGWCDIEDLSSPLVRRNRSNSVAGATRSDFKIKQEFEVKQVGISSSLKKQH